MDTSFQRGAMLLAIVLVPLVSCGGSGGQASGAPAAAPPPFLAPGTRLTFVSGETDQPVGGAAIKVDGKDYTTDSAGQIALADAVPRQALIDVTADGFLMRQTLAREASETRFTLWPRTSPTGLTEDFTARMLYSFADQGDCVIPQFGELASQRLPLGTTKAYVELGPEIVADEGDGRHPPASRAHADGIAVLNAALQGRSITYVVTTHAPAPLPAHEILFTTTIDSAGGPCQTGASAFFRGPSDSRGILGGSVVYCSLPAARDSRTVAHEFGHSFGMSHSDDGDDIMAGGCARGTRLGPIRFSPRETLLMGLMLQRRPLNRFPDNDRNAPATAATAADPLATPEPVTIREVVCSW